MSDRPTFAERLADPLSHFPYKVDDARAAAARTARREAVSAELASPEIEAQLQEALQAFADDEVDATAAYVAAQEAYLRAPSDETRADERAAADTLAIARAARREARPRLITSAARQDAAARNQAGEA